MNQIISQHGWGLDSHVWITFRDQFINNNWIWQDNERGYYNKNSKTYIWRKDNSNKQIRMLICHSLGTQLIKKSIRLEATHIVLINSFYNFIPKRRLERKYILRTLNLMKKKMENNQFNTMLDEFIKNSLSPKDIDFNFQKKLNLKYKNINRSLLMHDFEKLYIEYSPEKFFSENSNLLIINSKKDKILHQSAHNDFIKMINDNKIKKNIIELERQGHLPEKINLFEIIQKWLHN